MLFRGLEAGSTVHFRLADAVCPRPDEVIECVSANLEVAGNVLYLSDAGERKDYYAIVEVRGIMSPIIVPIDQLKRPPARSGESAMRL